MLINCGVPSLVEGSNSVLKLCDTHTTRTWEFVVSSWKYSIMRGLFTEVTSTIKFGSKR